LAAGASSNVLTSPSSLGWARQSSGPSESALGCVCYGGNTNQGYRYVAFGSHRPLAPNNATNDTLFTSTRGEVWAPSGPAAGNIAAVDFGRDTFVAVGKDLLAGTGKIFAAQNPVNLPMSLVTTWSNPLKTVRFAGGVFIACDSTGTVLSSFDGTNWVSHTGVQATQVAFGAGAFVGLWSRQLWQSDPVAKVEIVSNEELKISGIVGRTYSVESRDSLAPAGEWVAQPPFTLTASPFLWKDPNAPSASGRFYRARMNE
jgi:hypothetical protein